jgi:hypothetical protein
MDPKKKHCIMKPANQLQNELKAVLLEKDEAVVLC